MLDNISASLPIIKIYLLLLLLWFFIISVYKIVSNTKRRNDRRLPYRRDHTIKTTRSNSNSRNYTSPQSVDRSPSGEMSNRAYNISGLSFALVIQIIILYLVYILFKYGFGMILTPYEVSGFGLTVFGFLYSLYLIACRK